MAGMDYEKVRERTIRYIARYDVPGVTGYMKENCRAQTERLLENADDLMRQCFTFEDRWDMEPCHTPYTMPEMAWDRSPNGDPEWVYMLNRHGYLYKLLLAYRLTGNRDYVRKLEWFILDWIVKNPITKEGTETTRTIDTGIRCMNWLCLLPHLIGEDLIGQEAAEKILGSIGEQFSNLRERYIGKYTLSNWGVLQTSAFCMGYLWFAEYLPQDGSGEWAWQELEEQTNLQVMEDGSHWEQSMMYHMEVLLVCMRLLGACRDRGGLPADRERWLCGLVDRMSHYVLYAAAPDHCQAAQCDSDVTDVRDVLTRAAALTGNGEYRYGGFEQMDLENAWLEGMPGIRAYKKIHAVKPESLSLDAQDTGNIYFRSSWEEDGNFTYLRCGSLGSGHGHADLTHISLYCKGKPFLVDSGRYSYREDEPLRVLLKSAQAHNVCVIDGESQGIPAGSWSYDSYGECFKNYYREDGPVHYAEMAYHGSLRSGVPYLVIRKVMAFDGGIWLVVNDIRCSGTHQIKEYYHLAPGTRASAEAETAGAAGNAEDIASAGSSCAWSLEHDGMTLSLQGSRGFSKEACVLSGKYNRLEDSSCLIKTTGLEDGMDDWTSFTAGKIRSEAVPVFQYGASEPVTSDRVISRKYILPDGEEWIFLVWNRETFRGGKLYYCEGVPVYGKAAAICRKNGETVRYRLKN